MKLTTPVDPTDFSIDPILSNLQGNILKGHGREHTTHIFISFNPKGTTNDVRNWLRNFALEHVVSFKQQLRERELFKRNKVDGGLFASLFLTKSGYIVLGFDDVDSQLVDEGFKADMKDERTLEITNDPEVSQWEKGFQNEIHAMILLADDDANRMGRLSKTILEALEDAKATVLVEYGHAIRNANGDGIEHFGYVDGISQPLFLKDEIDAYMAFHNTNKSKAKFNPTADASLVLIKDPYVKEDDKKHAYGSYFVFRKLEQNVKAFKLAEKEVGELLFPAKEDEEQREIAGAYLVGRFEDGTPVVLDNEEGMIGSGNFNNFNYSNDPSGGRCPHFAHIRKTNPRRDEVDKVHTMARRGIPFGHRNVDTAIDPIPAQMPENGVGLLFMSYQASIVNQFEFIQKIWANNVNFSELNTGIDPIIGQSNRGQNEENRDRNYKFPKQYGNPGAGTEEAGFEQFVTMKGGAYFFAPSMSFFENL